MVDLYKSVSDKLNTPILQWWMKYRDIVIWYKIKKEEEEEGQKRKRNIVVELKEMMS